MGNQSRQGQKDQILLRSVWYCWALSESLWSWTRGCLAPHSVCWRPECLLSGIHWLGCSFSFDFHLYCKEDLPRRYWRPIGWDRISELVQAVHSGDAQPFDFTDDESDVPVADVATPYWERPVGPTWWCHLDAADPFVTAWFGSSRWLHPAISIALQEESRLISDRMKHLLYEVIETESRIC